MMIRVSDPENAIPDAEGSAIRFRGIGADKGWQQAKVRR